MMKKILLTILSTCMLAAAVQAPATAQSPASARFVAPVPASTAPPLDEMALKQATYSGILDDAITLKDGRYEGKPFVEGNPAKPIVIFADGSARFGDLNGDGVNDAVAFLQESGGGSGVFIYIAAQLNKAGKPVDAGAVQIEDRVQVKSIAIQDGQITLEVIGQGPGDAACCSSHKMTKAYALRDGKLAEVSAGESAAQKISVDDLNGTTWTLLEMKQGVPALDDAGVTLNIGEGQFSGSGGCNTYTGSFTLGKDNPFVLTMGDVVATDKACADPIDAQERAYFEALKSASQWGYEYGRLAIFYVDDAGKMSRLLFAPQADAALDDEGPAIVTGKWNYTSYLVATHFEEPVVALIDVSRNIRGDYTQWVPRTGQIPGTLTSPLALPPVRYQINVPRQPTGESADVDNDGQADKGVQIFAIVMGANLAGDSYLEQNEQDAFRSYLTDPQTGAIREGTLLVYAPGDGQGFPSSAGTDKLFFTADDPVAKLRAGYTLATLNADGTIKLSRERNARMDIREAASFASPDFSKQGILESFNSLIDVLKTRYSYTELRKLDWEKIRETYLPRVKAADEAGDMTAYYVALFELATSIRDSHVYVSSSNIKMRVAPIEQVLAKFKGSVGAQVKALSDGRFAITYVDPEGPAAKAGITFGTEIVSVNATPMAAHVAQMPVLESLSTAEGEQLSQLQWALSFPAGEKAVIGYRLPQSTELLSATLTAGEDFKTTPPSATNAAPREEISYKTLPDEQCYIQWTGFNDSLYKVAIWERFLKECQSASGVVIDLRGNGGGALELLYTLASYLFTEKDPAKMHWFDSYVYDDKKNDLVKAFAYDYMLTSPKPALTYSGAVAVLVDNKTASAGEYFPQFLQRQDRAIVVGEHGTEGAGGVIEQAKLPGDITFTFTKGRTVFAGTDELNLERKGVTLDVRAPITLQNERAKQDGKDPVLDAALAALVEQAASRLAKNLPGTSWKMFTVFDTSSTKQVISDAEKYTITFEEDGKLAIQADCNKVSATYTIDAGNVFTIKPGAATLAECPQGSRGADFLKWLGAATKLQTDGKQMVLSTDPKSGVAILAFDPAGQ